MFLLINKLRSEWPLHLQLGQYRTLTFDLEVILTEQHFWVTKK